MLPKLAMYLALSTTLMGANAALAGEANVIDEEAAKSCQFVANVSSIRLGMSPSKLINAALRDAYNKGVKKGANAVVLKSATPQGSYMNVLAAAYRCNDVKN